jgi:hypothetical protein
MGDAATATTRQSRREGNVVYRDGSMKYTAWVSGSLGRAQEDVERELAIDLLGLQDAASVTTE